MKMDYKTIIQRHQWLTKIGALTLPRKMAYAIAKNILTFEKEIEVFSKQQTDVANRYASKNEDGSIQMSEKGQIEFPDVEAEAAYKQEMNDLLDIEVDVPIYSFDETESDKCFENELYSVLTPIQLVYLDWMIDKKEEKSNG